MYFIYFDSLFFLLPLLYPSLLFSLSLFLFLFLSLSLRAVCEVILSEISTNNLMTWRQGLSLVNSIIPCVDYKVSEREREGKNEQLYLFFQRVVVTS